MAEAICSDCRDEVGSCSVCGHVFGTSEEYNCNGSGDHRCENCIKNEGGF